jgi:YD repeat-containing protein
MTQVSFGPSIGQRRTMSYDGAGNRTSASANSPETRVFTYDALNRVAREEWTATAAQFQSFVYTGHFIAYTYDAHGRRTSVTDRTGAVTQFAYDSDDRLLSTTLPNGRVIAVDNDRQGRPVKYRFPSALETRLTYDTGAGSGATGRLASITRGVTAAGLGGSPLNQLFGTRPTSRRTSTTSNT